MVEGDVLLMLDLFIAFRAIIAGRIFVTTNVAVFIFIVAAAINTVHVLIFRLYRSRRRWINALRESELIG